MPQDGPESLWYGSEDNQLDSDYSTNAYILLYEKYPTKQPHHNTQNKEPPVTNTFLLTRLNQIKSENEKQMMRLLLFGEEYKADFSAFIDSLVKLPKTPSKLITIY
jgi:hypothetical protein